MGIDILPVVLHGTGYTMSKGDFILKDGTITIDILPRIKAEDNLTYGEGYADKAKNLAGSLRNGMVSVRSYMNR